MKGIPTPPKETIGPFPLETNLRKLKPSLARLAPLLAGTGIVLAQEKLWDEVLKRIGTTSGLVILALLTAVIVFYVLDLYLKQVWFNERGIGIAKVWGGAQAWYSFDELKNGKFKMQKGTRGLGSKTRQYKPGGRLQLNFHTGSVRLWPNMYDSKNINDLLAILTRRFPDTYGPPITAKELKEAIKQELADSNKQTPETPSLFKPKKKERTLTQ
jgi:hypothetical protein